MRPRCGPIALLAAIGACTTVGGPPVDPGPEPVVDVPADRAVPPETAAPAGPVGSLREVRALWVVRWTMTSEDAVRRMVSVAAASGFNTLIVQVRGRADAFYRSRLEPRAEAVRGPADFDPLALAIEEGHRRGLAVHAWVNTHLVWGPGAPPESPGHIVNAHPDWLAVPRPLADDLFGADPTDRRFVQALRRYAAERPSTVEGIYTSPSHPRVRERVLEVWMDLLERYDLDGLHFDYIRFPSADFDYSRGAVERFRAWVAPRLAATDVRRLDAALGRDPFAYVNALPEEWDAFRRDQITSLVREIHQAVKARRPELLVSAAVVADVATAHETRFQDWRGWLREGILDVAVPMAYTPDSGRFRELVRVAREAAGDRSRLWAGVGAYMNTVEGTLDQIEVARAEDAGGVVLFSYDWAVGDGAGDPEDPFLERVGREGFDAR